MEDMIIVTDWETVDKDDYYLSDKWMKKQGISKKEQKNIRALAKKGELYEAFVISAKAYVIYKSADALKVFIDGDWNVLLEGEGVPIHTDFVSKGCLW